MFKLSQYIKTHKYTFEYLKKHYLSANVKEVLNKYNLTLDELCYRLKKDIPLDKVFKCRYCGNKVKYTNKHRYPIYCSSKCFGLYSMSLESVKNKMKQTCLARYGAISYAKTKAFKDLMKVNKEIHQVKSKKTCLEKYGKEFYSQTEACKKKSQQTCLEKYGVDSYSKTQIFKTIVPQKIKKTCVDKYGVDSYMKTKDFIGKSKQTCLKKYGVDNYTKTNKYKKIIHDCKNIIQNKVYNTKKKNNTYNKSKFEEFTYNLLLTKFTKEDIERQYKSEVYPFACDFYIKSKDLYIECNGHWSHGNKKGLGSFDKDNKKHLDILAKWQDKAKTSKFFQKAVYVWTILDVKKLECFRNNKLNYKIFWNLEEVKNWIDEIN